MSKPDLEAIVKMERLPRKLAQKLQRYLAHLRNQRSGITNDEDLIVRILAEKEIE